MQSVLDVNHLSVVFHTEQGNISALRDLSLSIGQGEILAVCGESGCGKSVFCKAVMGLLPHRAKITGGSIRLCGKELTGLSEREYCQVRGGDVAMVFQDPMTALDPACPIGKQIAEAIRAHDRSLPAQAVREKGIELMQAVGIDRAEERYDAYPWMLSGGMRQRCVLAMALAQDPKLLIADEPTTALDATVQTEILDLLLSLRKQRNFSILFISHDLGVIARIADTVSIMYAGKIIETGTAQEVLTSPVHPYTRGLLRALPAFAKDGKLQPIPGAPPVIAEGFSADAFAERNEYALGIDYLEAPPFFEVSPSHWAATWLLDPRAHQSAQAYAKAGPTGRHAPAGEDDAPATRGGAPATMGNAPAIRSGAPVRPALLTVEDLSCSFRLGRRSRVDALQGVSFDIREGEIFALVGESGSGKTTLARCILGMLRPASGKVCYDGIDITDRRKLRDQKDRLAREIQFISQDPGAALDPSMTVRDIIAEPLQIHRVFPGAKQLEDHIRTMLLEVQLDEHLLDRTPARLSGGQKQRVSIARAYGMDPKLLIADEMLASLDVSIQAQIVELLQSLRKRHDTAVLFISHDLAMVRLIADRVGVMQRGRLVEVAETEKLFRDPQHPYTRTLLSSMPVPDPKKEKKRVVIR